MDKTFINYMYGGFFQIGFVTKDVERAAQFFQNTMGVPKFQTFNNPEVKDQNLYGKPNPIEVNLAFGQMGGTSIELIQPLTGHSTYNTMLNKYEWIGIHHIAVKVFDFDKTVQDLEAQGFPVAQTGVVGKATRFTYMDTTKMMGHFTEVLFFDPDFEKLFDSIRRGDF